MTWYMDGVVAVEIPTRGGSTIALGDKALGEITCADIEALRDAWLARKRDAHKSGLVGVNRMLRRVRHFFNWCIEEGYREDTPFRRSGRPAIRLDRAVETGRTRRLEPGEEARLLKHAGPFIRDLATALIDTGCRKGELLNLRWKA